MKLFSKGRRVLQAKDRAKQALAGCRRGRCSHGLHIFAEKGERHVKTENEILEKAFDLFLKKGFSESSTNEIIREAGLTKGGFYYSFKSREDLVRRVIEKYIKTYYLCPLREMEQCWEDARKSDWRGAATELLLWNGFFRPLRFENYRRSICREDIMFRDFYFLLYEGMKKFPEVITLSQEYAAEKERCLRRILECGQACGEIRRDIDLESHITMILAMQDGILALKVLDDGIDDEEKYRKIQKQVWAEIAAPEAQEGFADGGVASAVS